MKNVVTALWCLGLPFATLLLGPLQPACFHRPVVNLVWDPLYSFGFTFVPHGNWHADTNPHPMAILGWGWAGCMFFLLMWVGYVIGKSRLSAAHKSGLALVISLSFLANISTEIAVGLVWLRFFIIEIS